jgi:hypothetical protein
MDYQRILIKKLIGIFSLLMLLTACGGPKEEITVGSIKVSPEPLQIIGIPPANLFYDSAFRFEFGASGGDGKYRYRYIQNPVSLSGEPLNASPNPVEMSIEVLDAAKPSFALRALPILPDDINFDELNDRTFTYQLELTDGNNTITRNFEFTLRKNSLRFASLSGLTEGIVNNSAANNLLTQKQSGQIRICNQITERSFEKRNLESGETIYPFVFHVFTDATVASRTELYYRLSSTYSTTEAERAERNIGYLRPDVDYIDVERSIILEQGQSDCIGFIDFLDDSLIEGDEEVRIEFFSVNGSPIDIGSSSIMLTLRDDELLPKYQTDNIVRNQGDKIVVPIKNVATRESSVSIGVSIDQDNSTADKQDFTLEPANGLVNINAGELEGAYTVTLNSNSSSNPQTTFQDKLITITTDLDKILEVEPYTIEINEWPKQNLLENEIISTQSAGHDVVSFDVDNDGIVTVLMQLDSPETSVRTILKSFHRDATEFAMTEQNQYIELSKDGVDIIPRALESHSEAGRHFLYLVVNVNSLFADKFLGGTDFVVMTYSRERGDRFVLQSANQYGTEGDDVVTGAMFHSNTLFVYGKTNGQNFEGQPSNESNNGAEDGFIYAINTESNAVNWTKFLGTTDNDFVVDIDAGNRDIVALLSTTNADRDAFVSRLSARTAAEVSLDNTVEFKTPREDDAVGIRFDATANTFRVLLNSAALLTEPNETTPSLSVDAQLLSFDSTNTFSGDLQIATPSDDHAFSFENMPDKQHFIIAGKTFGEFEDNSRKSINGADAFVSIYSTQSQSASVLVKTIQFGTPNDDQVIKVRPVSNTKFFVLWKENFTSNPNYVYRISAFSIDGRKLSRDPG